MEMHNGALKPGERVLLVDDLIATGGTCEAGIKLIRRSGAVVIGSSFIIDLPALGGRARIEALDVPVTVLCEFDGD
jgi:adenine phosphoribosyltransferase